MLYNSKKTKNESIHFYYYNKKIKFLEYIWSLYALMHHLF